MELFEEDGQPREKEIDYVQTAYQYLVKYSHLSILNKVELFILMMLTEIFQEFLKKEITSLTELSFQEQQNRQINWNKQENLKAAYWYLLQHCQPVLNEEEISGMIVDKVHVCVITFRITFFYLLRFWLQSKLMRNYFQYFDSRQSKQLKFVGECRCYLHQCLFVNPHYLMKTGIMCMVEVGIIKQMSWCTTDQY